MPGTANTLRGSPLCTDACRVRQRFSISAAAVACRPPASSPPPGTTSRASTSAPCRSSGPAAWCPPGPSSAPTPPASTCRRARPHPPAPARAAPPHRAHLHLAAPGRLAAGHRRRQRVDGHRGELARRSRRHVVEPGRRVDLPLLAAGGRAAGHRRGVRARGDERARPLLGPPAPSLTRSRGGVPGGAPPCRAGGGIPAAGYPHAADMAGPARPSAGPAPGPGRVGDGVEAGSGRRSLSISRRLWCAVSRCVAPGGWSMHSMNFHDWRARSECSPNEGRRGTRERRGITPPGRASCRSVGLVAVQAEPGHRGLCCPQCVWHHHGIFTPPVLPVS